MARGQRGNGGPAGRSGKGGYQGRGSSRRAAAGGRGRSAQTGRRGQNAPRGHGSRPNGGGEGRRDPRRDVIEGRRATAEALDAGIPIRRALVARAVGERDAELERLVVRLESEGVPVEDVPRERLDRLSSHGAHQGIVLEVRPFAYAELDDVLARAGSGDALVVVLDHVTDEGNFGAIVRSSEVVGAAGVVIPKARAASVGTAAYKTSAGAVLHVPIAQVPNLGAALDRLKEAGFWVAAATEHAEQDVWHAPLEGRLCLVMGSEGKGISPLVQKKCDFGCRLPQRGVVESLNVAQATTVLCYEWLRRTMGEGE